MTQAGVVLPIVVAISSLVLCGLWRRWALGRGVVDQPGARRSHSLTTARGGGIPILVASLLAVPFVPMPGPMSIWGSWVAIAAVGLLDDVRPLAARYKAVLQVLALLPLAWTMPFSDFGLTGIPAVVVALVIALACVNAWNFMDGINGLASTQMLLVVAFALALGIAPVSAPALGLVAIACAGFLPWNLPAGRLFLGDSGSHLMGAVVATVILDGSGTAVGLPWSLALVSAFAVDTLLTVLWRWGQGHRLSQAHREHLYQWAVRAGFTHLRISILYAAWTSLIGMAMLLMMKWQANAWAWPLLSGTAAVLVWRRSRAWLAGRPGFA